jgi:hypothetical protein
MPVGLSGFGNGKDVNCCQSCCRGGMGVGNL